MNKKLYKMTVKKHSTNEHKTRTMALDESLYQSTLKRLNVIEGDFELVYINEVEE